MRALFYGFGILVDWESILDYRIQPCFIFHLEMLSPPLQKHFAGPGGLIHQLTQGRKLPLLYETRWYCHLNHEYLVRKHLTFYLFNNIPWHSKPSYSLDTVSTASRRAGMPYRKAGLARIYCT